MTADIIKRIITAATLMAACWALPTAASAQDLSCGPGDTEVRGLDFDGNHAFTDAELGNVIVTTPSAWARRYLDLPFSARRCLNAQEFANDRLRLILFYRRRGFPRVTVDTARFPSGLGGANVEFRIREGPSTTLRSLVVVGLDSLARRNEILAGMPVQTGERFDRTRVDAAIDLVTRRLRNSGYPAVAARNSYGTTDSGLVALDTLTFQPGALTRVGSVTVSVTPARGNRQQISDHTVNRIVGIDSGTLFNEQALIDAQRALYQTDAYTRVSIGLDSAGGRGIARDSVAPLDISLTETTMHAARLGGGYGTLDCFRATGELDDYNFLSGARHLTIQGRVSKIGIGRPLDGAANLCPQAKADPYSSQLNYYLGATLRQPVFFGLRTVPTLTAYTSRVSEYEVYIRTTTVGGVATVQYQRWARTPITFGYAMDFGRTESQPALFCAVFNLCTAEERDRVQRNQRLAVVNAVVVHDATNDPVAPSAGSVARFELRHASPLVLSDTGLQFNTVLGEVSRYVSIGGGNVLAMHIRSGFVFGRGFQTNTGFIPPQERLYAGGPSSVRGFAQNELGADTYIAASYDTVKVTDSTGHTNTYFRYTNPGKPRRIVPVGGNSLLVGNLELRLRSPVLPDVLQFGLFVDAGDVWNRGGTSTLAGYQIKVTPGVQVAALTPIGPVRVVIGYNPYRQQSGPLYYESTNNSGALPCVAPGNTLRVTTDSTTTPGHPTLVQVAGTCSGYRPPAGTTLGSRLTFGLAIGQAF
ncbi:MAG: BamA/TamA family outer membrane protein [Gemmatimonadota bacterium]|nr:BamA/TamA family outer membrane protein [Gemmatimonadota bacterium]